MMSDPIESLLDTIQQLQNEMMALSPDSPFETLVDFDHRVNLLNQSVQKLVTIEHAELPLLQRPFDRFLSLYSSFTELLAKKHAELIAEEQSLQAVKADIKGAKAS